jgi:dihydropteroate synthase
MAGKDTPFLKKSTLNCKGKLLDISSPLVMGILNITPDSFFDGNKYTVEAKIKARITTMKAEGVDIVDIGGVSTRPKSVLVSEKEELKRVVPVIEMIQNKFPELIVSIDTFRANVASASIAAGAHIVNDISAGNFDSKMLATVAKLNVPYIMMHQKGTFKTMHAAHSYQNLLKEMIQYFGTKIKLLREHGLSDVIIDPGFGFSKNLEQNYSILKNLSLLTQLEVPLLVGISRKSMVNKILKTKPEEALNGTSVLNTLALQNGASILRVHDVKQAKQAIQLFQFYKNQE